MNIIQSGFFIFIGRDLLVVCDAGLAKGIPLANVLCKKKFDCPRVWRRLSVLELLYGVDVFFIEFFEASIALGVFHHTTHDKKELKPFASQENSVSLVNADEMLAESADAAALSGISSE